MTQSSAIYEPFCRSASKERVSQATPNHLKASSALADVRDLSVKVGYYVLYAFAGFAQLVVNCITFIPSVIQVLTFDPNSKHPRDHIPALKNEINRAQLNAYYAAAKDFNLSFHEILDNINPDISSNDRLDFSEKLHYLLKFIRAGRRCPIDAESIREMLNDIFNTEVYQALKKSNNNSSIILLQKLAYASMTADGSAALRTYGGKIAGDMQGDTSLKHLVTKMDELVCETRTFHWNNLLSDIFWRICHPLAAWNLIGSHLVPTEFDAHHGNPTFVNCEFTSGDKKALHILGPTPTDHKRYKAYLAHLKRNSLFESRILQEGPVVKGEIARVEKFQKEHFNQDPKASLQASVFSFDAPMMKNPSDYFGNLSEFSVATILEVYKSQVMIERSRFTHADPKQENGFHIPEHVLSADQLETVFEQAESIFSTLAQNNPFFTQNSQTPEGKMRICKMLQLGVQALMRTEMITQGLQEKDAAPSLSIVSEACKQDIDRGPVLNAATQIFFHFLTKGEDLSKGDIHTILGTIVGRALLVEDRLILKKRYAVLSDLLHFISHNTKAFKQALQPLTAI